MNEKSDRTSRKCAYHYNFKEYVEQLVAGILVHMIGLLLIALSWLNYDSARNLVIGTCMGLAFVAYATYGMSRNVFINTDLEINRGGLERRLFGYLLQGIAWADIKYVRKVPSYNSRRTKIIHYYHITPRTYRGFSVFSRKRMIFSNNTRNNESETIGAVMDRFAVMHAIEIVDKT